MTQKQYCQCSQVPIDSVNTVSWLGLKNTSVSAVRFLIDSGNAFNWLCDRFNDVSAVRFPVDSGNAVS